MLKIFQRKNKSQEHDGFKYRLALDIGTEFLKAVIVEFNGEERNIIGYSRVQQRYGDMTGGAIANIQGVLETARKAVALAKENTPHEPFDAVVGIAGEFVKGVVTTIEEEREEPTVGITTKELEILIEKAQQLAYSRGKEELIKQTGIKNLEIELVNTALVEVKIDGYKVSNPYQFQGKNISLSLFNTYAPLVNVGPLATVVEGLGYRLLGTIAEPYSIANSILTDEAYEFGAIVVDIGGGTMDVALIRNGGIEGTEMIAIGGRSFTRKIARELNVTLKDAEELKLKYSNDELPSDMDREIYEMLAPDLQLLYEGLELALKNLSKGNALPPGFISVEEVVHLKGWWKGLKSGVCMNDFLFLKSRRFLC
ncbi:cell division FtsA domain-containing protein [Anoxybacter fermentans]|uniref:cell division FtsA domain-containing protein n=1 Tax=Anoxybacter fermentans TaxID=1323375 RepID=UPI001F3D8F13|nr:cell division FtsA domain-containing protein [Anoxybacter fermentans]